MREDPKDIEQKVRTMPTDPARVRRDDPGEPEKCPVWALHQVYSADDVKQWVQTGCRTAGIGCVDCKQPVIDAIIKELKPIQERAHDYINDPKMVQNILNEGAEAASEVAQDTLEEVREAMGLEYS